MGHHCPVCHKATHKRCVEKGHLKICRVHGTICGHQRQCVNCSEELRQTLTPRKAEFGKDAERCLKRGTKPTPNPRSKRSAYAKLKEALCFKKNTKELARPEETMKFAVSMGNDEKGHRPAEQTAIEDPTWYQRHTPNTDEMLPRQAKPSKKPKDPVGMKKIQKVC